MLLETVDGKKFVAHFHHDAVERVSSCRLHEANGAKCELPCQHACFEGVARASKRDQFSKKMGRLISFGRASDKFDESTKKALRAAFRQRFSA